jgi:hypothetical protein
MLNTPSVMSSFRCDAGRLAQDAARPVDVLVSEHLDRGAAQPAAVDDARVVQLVADDDVFLREQGRHGAGVSGEAALEHDCRFGALELGEPPLQFTCRLIVPAIVRTEPVPTP